MWPRSTQRHLSGTRRRTVEAGFRGSDPRVQDHFSIATACPGVSLPNLHNEAPFDKHQVGIAARAFKRRRSRNSLPGPRATKRHVGPELPGTEAPICPGSPDGKPACRLQGPPSTVRLPVPSTRDRRREQSPQWEAEPARSRGEAQATARVRGRPPEPPLHSAA
jgi:hypothetical protein